jgi:hypothetical protein
MDDIPFDRIAKALGASPTRRAVLGLAVSAAIGSLAGRLGMGETDAKRKKKKKGCPKKPCPSGYRRDKGTCKCECVRTPCSGGKEFDTKSCSCRCKGMRECRDGCVPLDGCCPGDPPCPEDPKGCCHAPALDVCTIDGCCREIDGIKACNDFCVDTNTNRNHCGDCNFACLPTETCANGECLVTDECPDGRPPCPGTPGGDGPFCRPVQHEACCGDTSCNKLKTCCDPEEGVCCDPGTCAAGRCCTGGREVCDGGNLCCDFGQICCGTECCSESRCVNGSCCPLGACGALGSSNRLCVADGETCCLTGPDNSGHACPEVDFGGACANAGQCCPEGTFYDSRCSKCCADVRDLCEDCVPTVAGHF